MPADCHSLAPEAMDHMTWRAAVHEQFPETSAQSARTHNCVNSRESQEFPAENSCKRMSLRLSSQDHCTLLQEDDGECGK